MDTFGRGSLAFFLFVFLAVTGGERAFGAPDIKTLPEAERKIADTVDPWGLGFGDQVTRFLAYFDKTPDAGFVVGATHALVKIWPNKYWFRGDVFAPGPARSLAPIRGMTGGTASFQLAVLPKMGSGTNRYAVAVSCPVPARVWREDFVKVADAPYGALRSSSWPDPLVPTNAGEASGLNAAVFLVEVPIPADYASNALSCAVTVTDAAGKQVQLVAPIRVTSVKLAPRPFPLVAWFLEQGLTDQQLLDMYHMVLEHHLQPLIPDHLKRLWKPDNTAPFDTLVADLIAHGQEVFEIKEPDQALYDHLKAKGWLERFMIYSNADEPAAATFAEKNIPYAESIRKKFPGLKIFLASELHPRMAEGCDRWLTDLSSSTYDPRTFRNPEKPELWHYYCHLPVNIQMRAPLILAPNMQVDNPALEHRLALWMSWHYGARGVFIYGGDIGLTGDFYERGELNPKPLGYPYGGIHNGTGFLVYLPRLKTGGAVQPSLRLKILRDGVEDIALFEAFKAKAGAEWRQKLALAPDVFVHPHYYDRLPETLLQKRDQILEELGKQ